MTPIMKTITNLSVLLAALFITTLIFSCNKDNDNNNNSPVNPLEIPEPDCEEVTIKDAIILRFEYTNYTGQQPTATIIPTSTDARVQYEALDYTPSVQSDKIVIQIPNLSLRDDNFNYIAECVTIEEFDPTRPTTDRWFEQTEFKNSRDFAETKIAVMISLDLSSSLGEDRESVKTYAKEFAQQIFTSTSNESFVGLTLFADTVITYPFTNSINEIEAALNTFPAPALDAQTSTRLSDGILAGLDALDEADLDVADKVLVAFTDGNDNGSNNPTLNQQLIMESEYPRYMIGLKGKGVEYNSNYLESLASSETFFVEAENAVDLQTRFNDINELIANIYTITYNRSTQSFTEGVDEPIKLRAIFYAKPYRIE
jgi:hypothetical protein